MKPGTAQPNAAKIRKVYEFLQSQSTLVLSTVGAGGAPHATPLFYTVAPNLDLIWLSSASSSHSQSVTLDPQVSIAVFRATFEWRKIAGVQMRGLCSIVESPERSPSLDAYSSRFQLGTVPSLAISISTVYRFRPQWVRYIDNQKQFGYKFELVMPTSLPPAQ
jgi:uncharacterized protein YhbP (UPF0306 family)